ncbi:MAG: glycoside hydrolase family 13 protein [Phycisphaerae bacterium]|nr:glycoside hydrolase family 13 protein [Phycisphaerae bacterium]
MLVFLIFLSAGAPAYAESLPAEALTGRVVTSAPYTVERIEPPFWWTGMRCPELQIMIYGKHISDLTPHINQHGMTLKRTVSTGNKNYLFMVVDIAPDAPAGDVTVQLRDKDQQVIIRFDYRLLPRAQNAALRQGYDGSDVLYLITPDRFANGDPRNDNVPGMPDRVNRKDKWARHGGDLRGIIDRLDYLRDMGFTAVWLNPVLENNQPQGSYHGYATTDYYRVDPRLGTNAQYRELAVKAREKGIKIIMDMIMNHCGSEHWWMHDLPAQDWINHANDFFITNHTRTTVRDPYASAYDRTRFTEGWFVPTMPDLNQRNPLLARYLIQNTLWWIEYLGLAGIRMDTYAYSDKDFMRDWTCAVMTEYPHFNICGEEWSLNPAVLAYWQKGKHNPDGYTSCLPGLLDFPMQHALVNALVKKEAWDAGMMDLYEMLSNDFLYPDPFNHVIFPDNHDMSRIFTQLNEDMGLFKLAITYMATMRGVPQFYYGTEIAMSNTGDNSHGNIRRDFPGGWEEDEVNGVTTQGLTEGQMEAQRFVKKLLNWRRTATAIHDGKLIHFVPVNGVYTYFRFNDHMKVMVVLNKTASRQTVDLSRFSEVLTKDTLAVNVMSGERIPLDRDLSVDPKQPYLFELEPR